MCTSFSFPRCVCSNLEKQKWNDDRITCAAEKFGTQLSQCVLCGTLFPSVWSITAWWTLREQPSGSHAGNDAVKSGATRPWFDQAGTLTTHRVFTTRETFSACFLPNWKTDWEVKETTYKWWGTEEAVCLWNGKVCSQQGCWEYTKQLPWIQIQKYGMSFFSDETFQTREWSRNLLIYTTECWLPCVWRCPKLNL